MPRRMSSVLLCRCRIVRVMRKQLVRRSIDMMEELSKREDKSEYARFFESFSQSKSVDLLLD